MVPLSPSTSAVTMDQHSKKGMRTSRRRSRDSNNHKNRQHHDGTAIEMQSSSPTEGELTRQATQQATRAVAVAAKKEEESLYHQLLRHHKENNLDDYANSYSNSYSNSDSFDTFSVMSEEDRKLPAISSQAFCGRARKLPYSRNHVVIAGSRAESGEESSGKQEADVSDELYPSFEAFPRSYSGRSLPGSRIPVPSRKISSGDSPKKTVTCTAADITSSPPRDDVTTGMDMNDEDRKLDFKKPREQSDFYTAALEAAGKSDLPLIPPPNDFEQDERLARELSQLLEEPPPPSALDEELARVLQAAEPKPPEESEEDVVLALQLMEQEEKLHTAPSIGIAPTSTSALEDKELAIRLSKEMTLGGFNPNGEKGDELLAIQLSRFEKSTTRDVAKMVPEQLQILERIQQDKERKEIEQAMMESSLHELPVFQETLDNAEVGVSLNGSTYRTSEQDYQLSQELALNEWSSLQDQRAEAHPRGSGLPSRLRPSVSWSSTNRAGNGQLQRSQESNNVRSRHQGNNAFLQCAPGRAVTVGTEGRENPVLPRGGPQTRARSSVPGREGLRREPVRLSSQSQQDLMPPRPPDDLLRRGNQETRSAIATGRAHVVLCQGCDSRLHAPINYSLVFCPTCNTISPGLTATNSANASLSSRGGRM